MDLDYGLDVEDYYKPSMKRYAESVEKTRTGFYKALPDKLKTGRDLAVVISCTSIFQAARDCNRGRLLWCRTHTQHLTIDCKNGTCRQRQM